jgi:glycosyltransferase involved in cell wall biosynthesis
MSKIKVLHYSTHNEDCGIGKYNEQFIAAMKVTSNDIVYNEYFPYSPNTTKFMTHDEFSKVLAEFKEQLSSFDILHIQHELSFYKHDELDRVVDAARSLHKPVIMTIHTAPDAQYKYPKRLGYSAHSFASYIREIRAAREFTRIHIVPIRKADLILVHNTATEDNLIKHGVGAEKIRIITLPVPNISFDDKSTEIKKALKHKDGDVILASVGFISATKGVKAAVRSLKYLPDNYKLALVGGIHPSGGGEEYLDEVSDLIIKLGLKDRVYITGYVDEDKRLNSLIQECDVCIYPYDNKYYKYVSSAALNNALANDKPAITYPTRPFIEINKDETIAICKSANYYELARYVLQADYSKLAKRSKKYADKYSYFNESRNLVEVYKTVKETF